MKTIYVTITVFALAFSVLMTCGNSAEETKTAGHALWGKSGIMTGAEQTEKYLSLLSGKRVAMVANQTSVIGTETLVDSLMALGVKIVKVFGPEHGFRGTASAGAAVADSVDAKTGIQEISLYGKKSKPSKEDLSDVDLVIFDIQDVGARFYTYINLLARVMESCAESDKDLLILDRPNPNGFSVDGPILDPKLKSGIGMFPMPITHGMTIGELARMYNGEGWLANHEKCKITIIPVANYSHNMQYILPVAPSPNLNTQQSVWLYPSLCLFEGTIISQGRGTHFPFTVLGNPELKGKYEFSFTPVSIKGMAETPLFQDKMCYGLDLRNYDTSEYRETGRLILKWLIEMYQAYPYKEKFFDYRQSNQIGNFDKLAGTTQLKQQIISGKSEEEIRDSWEPGLSEFKKIREKYLLYSSGPNDENKVRQIVSSNQTRFAPDHRTAIDQVEVTTVAGKIILKGITDIPVAKKALLDSLGALNIPFADSVKVLPDSALGDKTWGLVALSVTNLRGGPGHANELVSQALMGTPLRVLQYADGWYRVQTPDYYIGWMEGSGIQRLSEAELNQWKQSSRYVFNRISGNAFESPDEGSLEVSDLVLGDLFVVEAAVNGFLKMQTPDGRTGYVRSSDCLSWNDWAGRKPDVNAVIAVARKMLGMPYLWGGTSTKSVDCSGLTKTAYFSQGIILARDASQQARYGEHPDFSDFHNLQPGDLLFFGRDEQHVTHVALYMGDGKYIHSSGLIRINSLDPDDPKYDATLKKKLLGSARVLNSLNTEGITLVKDHPWYSVVNQK